MKRIAYPTTWCPVCSRINDGSDLKLMLVCVKCEEAKLGTSSGPFSKPITSKCKEQQTASNSRPKKGGGKLFPAPDPFA